MQSKSAYYTNERIEGIKERLRRFNSSKLSLSQTSEEMININLPHDMMENENNSTHSENRSTNEVNNAVRVDNSKMPFMSSSSSSSSLSPSSLFPLLPTSISTLLSSSESKQTILETPLTSSQEKSVSRTSNTQKREGYDDMQTPSTSTVSETRRDYKKNDTSSTKETNKKQKEDKSYKHEQYDNKIQETDKNNCHNKNNNINNNNNNNNNNNKTNKIRESVPNNCSEHNELKEMKCNDYEQDVESREQQIENAKNNVHRKSVADSLRAFMRAVAQVENDVKESSLHSETKNTRKHANSCYKKDHHDHFHNNNSNKNSKNIKNNVANENNRNAKINNNISATTDDKNNIINNRKSTIENGLHKCDTSVEYKEEKEELPHCEQEWADAFNEQNIIKANKKKLYRDDCERKRQKKISELTEEERNERQQTNELSNSTHKLSSVTTKEFHYQQEEELEEEEEKKWEESEQRQFTNSSEELEAAELLLTRLRQLANEKVNASTEEKTVQTRTTESKSGNEAKSENKSEHVNVNTQNIEERVFESFIRANEGQVDLQRNRKTMREQYEHETHKEQETNSPLTRINLLQQQQQEQQQHHLQCHKYHEEDDAMESNINNNSNLCRNECRSTMESTHSSYNSSTTTSMSSDPFTNHNPFENASSLSTESLSTLSESDLSSNECEVMLAKMTATSTSSSESSSSSLSASSEENTNKQQLLFSGQEQNVNKNVINNYTDIKMKANTLEEVLTNATSKECNTCVEENKKINVNKSTVSNMHCYFTERIAAYVEKLKLFATATAAATTNTTNTKKKKSNAYINHSSSVDNADNNISLQSSQTELYEDLFNHLEVAETVIANAHASVERLARLHHNTSLPHSLPHVEKLEKLQRRREALLQEEAPLRHGAAPIEMTLTSIQEKYNKPFQQHLNALSFLYANTSLQTKTILSRRGGVEASRLLCQERERDLNERRRASEIISHEIKELETELQTRQAALREREAKYKERLREHGERDERIQHYIDGVEELGMTIST